MTFNKWIALHGAHEVTKAAGEHGEGFVYCWNCQQFAKIDFVAEVPPRKEEGKDGKAVVPPTAD